MGLAPGNPYFPWGQSVHTVLRCPSAAIGGGRYLYCPWGHVRQSRAVEASPLKCKRVPAEHLSFAVHDVNSWAFTEMYSFPASQSVQAYVCVVLTGFPVHLKPALHLTCGSQLSEECALFDLKNPVPQALHLRSTVAEGVPVRRWPALHVAVHAEQLCVPAFSLTRPAPQSLHMCVVAAGFSCPAGHALHVPATGCCPTAQLIAEHDLKSGATACVFVVQLLQEVAKAASCHCADEPDAESHLDRTPPEHAYGAAQLDTPLCTVAPHDTLVVMYLPAGGFVVPAAPSLQYFPAVVQAEQVVARLSAAARPAGHSVHTAALLAEYDPALQATQLVPDLLYPAAHVSQVVAPVLTVVLPPLQSMQLLVALLVVAR